LDADVAGVVTVVTVVGVETGACFGSAVSVFCEAGIAALEN
jgi:hypothetical protein